MNKLLLSTFLLIASVANAQEKGEFNLGVHAGLYNGLQQGYLGQYGVNAGHTFSKGLVIGGNASFRKNTWPSAKLGTISKALSPKYTHAVYGVDVFAKRYVGQKRFKPFVQAGLGLNLHNRYFTDSGGSGAKDNEIKPNMSLGLGAACFFGKNKKGYSEVI